VKFCDAQAASGEKSGVDVMGTNKGKTRQPRQQSAEGQKPQNIYGEGNYAASREYDDATRKYAQSGKVEQAARDAAPRSSKEAREMKDAEAEGKRHAKEEDPALERKTDTRMQRGPEDQQTPKPGQDEE
jgi:hypothetical protein